MAERNPRRPVAVFLSLPTSIGLLALFFLPWLRLSCNPRAVNQAPDPPPAVKQLTGTTVLAHASGWDLARGKLTPAKRFQEQARAAEGSQEGPPAKPWAYGGLVLPGLAAVFALLCLAGSVTPAGGGKCVLLLGIAGVVLMCVAASMDYVDEAMDKAKEEMAAQGLRPGCPAFRRSMAEAADKAKEVLQTKATPYLWASLVLYGLLGGCGLALIATPDDLPAAPGEPGRVSPIPGHGRRGPGGLPDFGPDLTPPKAAAPVAGDEADSGP